MVIVDVSMLILGDFDGDDNFDLLVGIGGLGLLYVLCSGGDGLLFLLMFLFVLG